MKFLARAERQKPSLAVIVDSIGVDDSISFFGRLVFRIVCLSRRLEAACDLFSSAQGLSSNYPETR